MMTKINQADRVLQFIKENGSITRLQAANEVGAFELASRIGELEDKGYSFTRDPIKVKNRYGDSVRIMRYSLEKGEKYGAKTDVCEVRN